MSYANAYAPRIILPKGYSNPGKLVEAPRTGKMAEPNVSYVGICLVCGEQFYGPRAVRLMQGGVEKPENSEGEFKIMNFEDGSRVQWLCPGCAEEHLIIRENEFLFTSKLNGLARGWCTLCHQLIEPYPNPQWSTAVNLERGLFQTGKTNAEVFSPLEGGHLHFCCLDDLGLELWRLINQSDAPFEEEEEVYTQADELEDEIDDWEWSDDFHMWYSPSHSMFYDDETGEYHDEEQ